MPSSLWKAQVEQIEDNLDSCMNRLDKLAEMDKGATAAQQGVSRKIYDNGSTTVEVSIKTRKPKGSSGGAGSMDRPQGSSRCQKWDSILSQQSELDSDVTEEPPVGVGVAPRKYPSERQTFKASKGPKAYAQGTKSSQARSVRVKPCQRPAANATPGAAQKNKRSEVPVPATALRSEAAAKPTDVVDAHRKNLVFPARTLQVFLHEMRATLKASSITTEPTGPSLGQPSSKAEGNEAAFKVLDDLEFIAANLDLEKAAGKAPSVAGSHLNLQQKGSPTRKIAGTEAGDVKELQRLTRDREALEREVEELKRKLAKIEKQAVSDRELLREKDLTIEDLKAIVSRLTTNNSDMLAILTTKVRLEETLKTVEAANRKLMTDLAEERRNKASLEVQLSAVKREVVQLRNIIQELKKSWGSNLREVMEVYDRDRAMHSSSKRSGAANDHRPGSASTTIDLNLSSDHPESTGASLDSLEAGPEKAGREASPTSRPGHQALIPHTSLEEGPLADVEEEENPKKARSDDEDEHDRDSAIEAGNSESHPLSASETCQRPTRAVSASTSASTPKDVPKVHQEGPQEGVKDVETVSVPPVSGDGPVGGEPRPRSGDRGSGGIRAKRAEKADKDKAAAEAKALKAKAKAEAAAEKVNEKVRDFLDRMRNDDRYNVSLGFSADLGGRVGPASDLSSMHLMDMSSTSASVAGGANPALHEDIDSLSESKFLKGLESTLNND